MTNFGKYSVMVVVAAVSFCLLSGCSDDGDTTKKDSGAAKPDSAASDFTMKMDTAKPMEAGAATGDKVKLVTSLGDITIELNKAKAPITVANFLAYVKAGTYDGTIFHRVIDGFMIQGGGYTSSYTKKSTNAPIKNEADNGLSNLTGTIAMARTSVVDSATNQFFINVKDNTFLDHKSKTTSGWGYAVFGKVVAGMDTVNKIKAVNTGAAGPFSKDAPLTPVEIKKASVVK